MENLLLQFPVSDVVGGTEDVTETSDYAWLKSCCKPLLHHNNNF